MHIVKVTEPDLMDLVHNLMDRQGHAVPYLTHVMMVDNEIRGAYSEVLLPAVLCWFNLEYQQPKLIYNFIEYLKERGKELGYPALIWAIHPNVQPYKYAERVGLTPGGNADWFLST